MKKTNRTGTLLRRLRAPKSPVQWYTLSPLFIHALGYADDRGLGRTIDRHARLAAAPGLARKIDDLPPFPGSDHLFGDRLRGEKKAPDIDIKLTVEMVF